MPMAMKTNKRLRGLIIMVFVVDLANTNMCFESSVLDTVLQKRFHSGETI